METITISVYASRDALIDRKKLFERQVSTPEACAFDFSLVLKSMRILFGACCVVVFDSSRY